MVGLLKKKILYPTDYGSGLSKEGEFVCQYVWYDCVEVDEKHPHMQDAPGGSLRCGELFEWRPQ